MSVYDDDGPIWRDRMSIPNTRLKAYADSALGPSIAKTGTSQEAAATLDTLLNFLRDHVAAAEAKTNALQKALSQAEADKAECQEAAQKANEAAALANADNERLRAVVKKQGAMLRVAACAECGGGCPIPPGSPDCQGTVIEHFRMRAAEREAQ